MKAVTAIALAGLAVLLSCASAAGETEKECLVRMATTTKLNAWVGDAVAKFVPDSDPDTLEVVFLSNPEQGKSRVSDDGQVIYVNNATDEEQEALALQAFQVRLKLGYCSREPGPEL